MIIYIRGRLFERNKFIEKIIIENGDMTRTWTIKIGDFVRLASYDWSYPLSRDGCTDVNILLEIDDITSLYDHDVK